MTDPTQGPGGPGGPSEAEVQQYLEQLRGADATEIVAQAFNLLATGAQVKLGRPDARTLIDTLDAVAKAVGGQVADQVASQMQEGVRQLQAAQVQAEQEAVGQPAEEPASQRPAGGDAEPGGQRQPGPAGDDPSKRMTDRLWVPGKQPGTGR